MGSSPKASTKKVDTKSPIQPNAEPPAATELAPKPEDALKAESSNAEPLAPPPRPAPVGSTPDYFSSNHGHLSSETNPFEYSFAGGSTTNGGGVQTPGGTKLPSVAALTSPAGILGAGVTPNFW
jgi:ATF/CREB family transcription factor